MNSLPESDSQGSDSAGSYQLRVDFRTVGGCGEASFLFSAIRPASKPQYRWRGVTALPSRKVDAFRRG